MQAIVQDRYGPVELLRLREVESPSIGNDEVLVRVRAASVHPDVWHVVRGLPYVLRLMGAGLRRPTQGVPGTDVAGEIAAVGRNVTRFVAGDAVFGETVRGHQWHNGGAFAEYVAVREQALQPKPGNVSFVQTAAVPTSGMIAVQTLGGVHVRPGHRVLVNGAGGGVGTFVVQLSAAYGAHVTAVDTGVKLDMLRSIGAAQVIDHTREDCTRRGERWNVIVDVATSRSLADYRRALTPEGTYLFVGHDRYGARQGRWLGSLGWFLRLMVVSPFVHQVPGLRLTDEVDDPLARLREHIEAGRITPVVDDRVFTLREVPEAIRYLAEGRAVGRVVVTV
jgi:NADPH:quinone reductase-like Zn-dependent oxidoreductase